MKSGVVKWFNNAKGYGFILSDDENKDVFAHYSSIDMDGYRTLRAGQCVAFEAIDGPKGLHAMSIRVLEEVTLTGVPNEQVEEQKDTSPEPAQAAAEQPDTEAQS
ncbi:MAG: cold shock domain-containing protein [Pseudomonadales bacterium]|nr:cold shock domain-containing protein [Gammaproteobacteria bacterium]NNL56135.1 cold shock domain-containing protein [Pseudomonadales bacterium]